MQTAEGFAHILDMSSFSLKEKMEEKIEKLVNQNQVCSHLNVLKDSVQQKTLENCRTSIAVSMSVVIKWLRLLTKHYAEICI